MMLAVVSEGFWVGMSRSRAVVEAGREEKGRKGSRLDRGAGEELALSQPCLAGRGGGWRGP